MFKRNKKIKDNKDNSKLYKLSEEDFDKIIQLAGLEIAYLEYGFDEFLKLINILLANNDFYTVRQALEVIKIAMNENKELLEKDKINYNSLVKHYIVQCKKYLDTIEKELLISYLDEE